MAALRTTKGFVLKNIETPWGWDINETTDIMPALLGFPCFQYVSEEFMWEAVKEALKTRKKYDDIKDFARYIAHNYI